MFNVSAIIFPESQEIGDVICMRYAFEIMEMLFLSTNVHEMLGSGVVRHAVGYNFVSAETLVTVPLHFCFTAYGDPSCAVPLM